jgi:hypothetical protein
MSSYHLDRLYWSFIHASIVRQIKVHTAEPLVPGPSRLEVETAIGKSKKYKSPGSDQILPEPIQTGG